MEVSQTNGNLGASLSHVWAVDEGGKEREELGPSDVFFPHPRRGNNIDKRGRGGPDTGRSPSPPLRERVWRLGRPGQILYLSGREITDVGPRDSAVVEVLKRKYWIRSGPHGASTLEVKCYGGRSVGPSRKVGCGWWGERQVPQGPPTLDASTKSSDGDGYEDEDEEEEEKGRERESGGEGQVRGSEPLRVADGGRHGARRAARREGPRQSGVGPPVTAPVPATAPLAGPELHEVLAYNSLRHETRSSPLFPRPRLTLKTSVDLHGQTGHAAPTCVAGVPLPACGRPCWNRREEWGWVRSMRSRPNPYKRSKLRVSAALNPTPHSLPLTPSGPVARTWDLISCLS